VMSRSAVHGGLLIGAVRMVASCRALHPHQESGRRATAPTQLAAACIPPRNLFTPVSIASLWLRCASRSQVTGAPYTVCVQCSAPRRCLRVGSLYVLQSLGKRIQAPRHADYTYPPYGCMFSNPTNHPSSVNIFSFCGTEVTSGLYEFIHSL
jgi:hypothetical protein